MLGISAADILMASIYDVDKTKENDLYNNKVHYLSISAAALEQADTIIHIHLAHTGEGIVECELCKCFVKEGDEVEEDQSDKATIEITSRYQGKVVQFLHVTVDIVKAKLAVDHRILDRATVAQFCNEWKKLIEKSELVLLHTR
ncbi:putative dihydrolipoyllysine-residue (2-methylpropanoyl)transferase [Helianthus debilis subsp. tardiflorus]